MPLSKLISYVFYCFMNFLCISLFFRAFCFCCFFRWNLLADTFWSTIMLKQINFSHLRVQISIFIWTLWKNSFALILYTKSHFGAIFGPTCMYKKLRKFRTVPPASQVWCQNGAGNLKEKSHKVSRRELCALQSNRAKCRGGGPPPQSF